MHEGISHQALNKFHIFLKGELSPEDVAVEIEGDIFKSCAFFCQMLYGSMT